MVWQASAATTQLMKNVIVVTGIHHNPVKQLHCKGKQFQVDVGDSGTT